MQKKRQIGSFRKTLAAALIAGSMGVMAPASADILVLTPTGVFTPPNTPSSFPAFLTQGDNSVTVQFFVPNFAAIQSINALSAAVAVYEDASDPLNRPDEAVLVRFCGVCNADIAFFAGDLAGTTIGSPFIVTGSMDPADLFIPFIEITDNGFFRIRVRREEGDFFVNGASVTLDVTFAPTQASEPSTVWCLALGAIPLLVSRLRKRRQARR
jgi:hypothetical protein